MLLTPFPSVTNCHTFSDPSPSSVTYIMDGPHVKSDWTKMRWYARAGMHNPRVGFSPRTC